MITVTPLFSLVSRALELKCFWSTQTKAVMSQQKQLMFVSSSLNVPNMIWYLSVLQHYQIRQTTLPAYKTSNTFFPLINWHCHWNSLNKFILLLNWHHYRMTCILSILQKLDIYNCQHLLEDAKRKKGEQTSLPDKMHSLNILQKLEIYNCLHLWKMPKGNRWRSAQIAHVLEIHIRWRSK